MLWWVLSFASVPCSIRCYLCRLFVLAAVCLSALLVTCEARADAPVSGWVFSSYTGAQHPWGASQAALCTAPNVNRVYSGTLATVYIENGYCKFKTVGSGDVSGLFMIAQTRCGDGTFPNTSKPLADQCGSGTAPPVCTDASVKNKYVGAWVVGQGGTAPAYACIQGCQYPQGSTAVGLQTSYGMSVGQGNGQTCTGANYDSIDTTTKPSDPPSVVSCGKMGLVYGTFNGVGICQKGGEIPGTSVTKTDTSATTKTDASGVQAPSQTTNTTTNVTNVNGVSTVTQTTTKPDGTKETTTETKDSFCSKHPDDAVCKTESQASGGDDCKVPPVCKGDAIQCAMLSQQWKTRCDNQQTNAASDLATQVLGGNDPSKNPADKENRDVRPIANSIDQTAFLGGGGLQDKVVTVSGQSITLPFSRLNQYLEWIGRLFVVLSLIGAIRIVLGGFKK